MTNRIKDTVNKFNMFSKGDSVLIALSGGADSVLLTHFLLKIKDEYDLKLTAAHLEHGIRGEESIADAEFCEAFCNANGIDFKILHINAPVLAKEYKMSVEEYSRKARYDFFGSFECDKIATAHNLSDNIETMLFRIARGTSIKGLCAIPPVRGKIVRPLIEIGSDEIRSYLDDKHIAYRIDKTNSDDSYTRNFIRHQIIPRFKEVNDDFENHVFHLISSVRADEEFLEKHIEKIYADICINNELDISRLIDLSESEVNRIIVKWLKNNGVCANDNIICGISSLRYRNSRFQISGNLFALSAVGRIRLAVISQKDENVSFNIDKSILSVKDFLNKCEFNGKKFDFYCDCDKIVGNVTVRSRMQGDKISVAGRNCSKSLKKLFNELHIPAEKRYRVPVVADDAGVIGVAGYAVSERVCVNSSTKRIMIINIRTEDRN